MVEIAIDVNEANVVSVFSQHRITEELSGTGQFLPATLSIHSSEGFPGYKDDF